jgi:carboxypeptidase C (cathepsin A)
LELPLTKPALPVSALLAAALLALLVILPGAFAEDHPQSSPPQASETQSAAPEAKSATEAKPAEAKPEAPQPSAITQHTIKLGNETLSYTAEIGALPLRDDDGGVTANIYYVA